MVMGATPAEDNFSTEISFSVTNRILTGNTPLQKLYKWIKGT
jgi:hypothetical protein